MVDLLTMRRVESISRRMISVVLLTSACVSVAAAQAFTTLHVFTNTPDGFYPYAGVVTDASGSLFGTTAHGGAEGGGLVYELSPPVEGETVWTETMLYSFGYGATPAGVPYAPVWFGTAGDLLGSTFVGGNGTIFKLRPPADGRTNWEESILYNFSGSPGDGPLGSMVANRNDDRFGVTYSLGTFGCGTVYKLSAPTSADPTGRYQLLYTFTCLGDGGYPEAGLVSDANGNLYGTASSFGAFQQGVVYELSPPPVDGGSWTETTIYTFTGSSDGGDPWAKLLLAPNGSLYGTTQLGGNGGVGVAFELTPPAAGGGVWAETVLIIFNPQVGSFPTSALISDGKDGFYTTTSQGGLHGAGVVCHLQPPAKPGNEWAFTALHQFTEDDEGYSPVGDLLLSRGALYGVTQGFGSTQAGTVYQLIP